MVSFGSAAVPITLLAAFIASRDPAMKTQYPFSKEACAGLKKFVVYETFYLGLYYLPWEFLFPGSFLCTFIIHSLAGIGRTS